MEPEPAKTECGKYTLLIGLVKVADEYLTEASRGCDLTSIKESVMHKVLNINNYIKSLCDYYAREKRTGENDDQKTKATEANASVQYTAMNLEKFVSRDEFFVYSVSVTFNPRIHSVMDLLGENNEGDGVCTITVKMPKEKQRQAFYIRLMLKLISKHSLMLKLTAENASSAGRYAKGGEAPTSPTRAHQSPEPKGADSPPGYFDDEPKNDKPGMQCHQFVKAGTNSLGSYSFFNQSSMILSKYVNSNLVLHEDDQLVAERLRREKEKKKAEK